MAKAQAAASSVAPRTKKWSPGLESRAHVLLRKHMERNELDIAKLSRILKCTWTRANDIVDGAGDPTLAQMHILFMEASIPPSAWMESP